MARYQLQAVD
ncbi:hypothetical protein RDI58_010487 [Solanum bulbocastanum]|uniref:Uncharacterized protein n=1 Tax=Solanum bulbocastanum TaxID=147425 RepID=A0AAN8TWG8_SOLBU